MFPKQYRIFLKYHRSFIFLCNSFYLTQTNFLKEYILRNTNSDQSTEGKPPEYCEIADTKSLPLAYADNAIEDNYTIRLCLLLLLLVTKGLN